MDGRKTLKNLLHFNRGERGGMVVLLLLMAGTIGANLLMPLWERRRTYDFTAFEQALLEFEARRVSDSIARAQIAYHEQGERTRYYKRSSDEGRGRPAGNYRKNHTGTSAAARSDDRDVPNLTVRTDRVDSAAHRPDSSEQARPPLLIELNTADSLDLQQLRGIGPSFSRRIVKYRQLLGGYARVEQLLEVYGMDSSRYSMIAGHLTVDTARLQKIDLSTATIKELMRHPYIEFYMAKLLVSCRESGGPITSFGDLEERSGIPPALLLRIRPYLAL